jgi:KRAB domain-containing zinc finger protein
MPESVCNICTSEIDHWETLRSSIKEAQIILADKVKQIKETQKLEKLHEMQDPLFVIQQVEDSENSREASEIDGPDFEDHISYNDSSDGSIILDPNDGSFKKVHKKVEISSKNTSEIEKLDINSPLKHSNTEITDNSKLLGDSNKIIEISSKNVNEISLDTQSCNSVSENCDAFQNNDILSETDVESDTDFAFGKKSSSKKGNTKPEVLIGTKYRPHPIRSHSPNNPYLCGECHDKFKTDLELEKHLNDHRLKGDARILFCAHCNVKARAGSTIVKHQKDHILKPDAIVCFTCLLCPQQFTGRNKLKAHLINSHKRDKNTLKNVKDEDIMKDIPYKKPIARNVTRKNRTFPIRSHSPNHPYLCGSCPAKFKKSSDLENHVTCSHVRHKKFTIFCAHCNVKYQCERIKKLIYHQKMHILNPNSQLCYTCTDCPDAFLARFNLHQHMKKMHKKDNFKGFSRCENSNETVKELKNYYLNSETKFVPYYGYLIPCTACDMKFSNYTYFVNHFKKHTDIHKNNIKQCLYCGHICDSETSYMEHIKIHLGANNLYVKATDKQRISGKKVLCPICGIIVQSGSLKSHLKSHADKRNFKCTTCNKAFKSLNSLNYHMQVHYDNRYEYQCDFCQKSFPKKYALQKHIMVHLNYKPFKCDVCSFKFTTISYLKKHLKTHFRLQLYYCVKCKRSYKDLNRCRLHMKLKCNVPREEMGYKA